MGANGFIRKVTAIMSAKVVGYSKLMSDDEAATVQTLTVYKNVMSALNKSTPRQGDPPVHFKSRLSLVEIFYDYRQVGKASEKK